MAHSSMLHVRVDDELKADATEKLASFGLTISDAVRILLTRITKEGGLPVGLTADPETHDAWFRDKVKEALDRKSTRLNSSHVRISYAVFCLKKKKKTK